VPFLFRRFFRGLFKHVNDRNRPEQETERPSEFHLGYGCGTLRKRAHQVSQPPYSGTNSGFHGPKRLPQPLRKFVVGQSLEKCHLDHLSLLLRELAESFAQAPRRLFPHR
jgi:hypothetical protein